MKRLILLLLVGIFTAILTSPTQAQELGAGLDLLESGPTSTDMDLSDLSLLLPGAMVVTNPPSGVIKLEGVPIGIGPCCPGNDLGSTDTVVKRPSDSVGLPGGSAIIPIEICELHLQSIQPFTVQDSVTLATQEWVLTVDLNPTTIQPQGQMTVFRIDANGGTFESELPVIPRLTFIRVDDGSGAVMGVTELPPVVMVTPPGTPWTYAPLPGECVAGGCTTNFFPGPYLQSAPRMQQSVNKPTCGPVPVEETSWGKIKSLYGN